MLVKIGKGLEMDVDYSRFNDAVDAHIKYMGLRNVLMDSHATHTAEADGDEFVAKSLAAAQKKLDSLYAGEVRAAGERDPVRTEAIRLALIAIKGQIKKAQHETGKKLADYDQKVLREKAVSIHDRFMATARKNVEAAKNAGIDVSDIEL